MYDVLSRVGLVRSPVAILKFENVSFRKDTTTASLSTGVILAPGDVRPGHMIFAPLKTNLIAPLSTCSCGSMNGSVHKRKKFVKQIEYRINEGYAKLPLTIPVIFTKISMRKQDWTLISNTLDPHLPFQEKLIL